MVCVSTNLVQPMAQAVPVCMPASSTSAASQRPAWLRGVGKSANRFINVLKISACQGQHLPAGAQLEAGNAGQGAGVDTAQVEPFDALLAQRAHGLPQEQIMDVQTAPLLVGPADVVAGTAPV